MDVLQLGLKVDVLANITRLCPVGKNNIVLTKCTAEIVNIRTALKTALALQCRRGSSFVFVFFALTLV